jgi:hypothetical protein
LTVSRKLRADLQETNEARENVVGAIMALDGYHGVAGDTVAANTIRYSRMIERAAESMHEKDMADGHADAAGVGGGQ